MLSARSSLTHKVPSHTLHCCRAPVSCPHTQPLPSTAIPVRDRCSAPATAECLAAKLCGVRLATMAASGTRIAMPCRTAGLPVRSCFHTSPTATTHLHAPTLCQSDSWMPPCHALEVPPTLAAAVCTSQCSLTHTVCHGIKSHTTHWHCLGCATPMFALLLPFCASLTPTPQPHPLQAVPAHDRCSSISGLGTTSGFPDKATLLPQYTLTHLSHCRSCTAAVPLCSPAPYPQPPLSKALPLRLRCFSTRDSRMLP
jgi:hypothetical protein